jgi:aspartokinase
MKNWESPNPIKRKDRLIMTEKKQNKNRHFNFRVNEKEYNKIKSKIENSKLNTSEYLLRTAMNKEIIVIEGLETIIIQLRKIGNNINQLTKLCNQGRLRNINLEDIKKEMKSIWQLLNLLIQKQS